MVQYWYCMLSYILKQNDDGGCYIQNRKAWFRNLNGTSCVYSKNSQFQIFVKLEICCFSIFHPKELWAGILHWQCLAAFLSRNMAEPPLLKDHIFMTCRNIVYAQFPPFQQVDSIVLGAWIINEVLWRDWCFDDFDQICSVVVHRSIIRLARSSHCLITPWCRKSCSFQSSA